MSRVRRRVLRSPQTTTPVDPRRHARLEKKRSQLITERAALHRWMSRLKRAFHAVEKLQAKIGRLERDVARLEQR
jgi:hypothetical protein